MRIAIIGTGGIASGLAALFSRSGHTITLGSRNPHSPNRLGRELGLRPVDYRTATESAEILCFCVPWAHSAEAIQQLGDISGKILVDPSNPEAVDGRSLELGHSVSGAEIIASRALGSKVVKAFNYVYAELLRHPEALAHIAPSIFYCGDDGSANAQVAQLISSCGLEPIDCGPLANARYLEPLALLMVQLVRNQGWPPAGVGMRLAHQRPDA